MGETELVDVICDSNVEYASLFGLWVMIAVIIDLLFWWHDDRAAGHVAAQAE